MKVIAHRCGTDKHPGLSVQAALHSLALGARYAEMDVRYTRDLRPVICHDRDASALYPGAHSLEEMLSGVPSIVLHIKEGGDKMPLLLDLIKTYKCEDKIVLGVAAAEDAARVKRFNPAIPVLAFMPSLESAAEFVAQGADILRLWENWATEDAIRQTRALGKEIWIMARGLRGVGYTSKKNLLLWRRLGVGGVLVNDVEKTISILQKETVLK